jgi:hypothetical protein
MVVKHQSAAAENLTEVEQAMLDDIMQDERLK